MRNAWIQGADGRGRVSLHRQNDRSRIASVKGRATRQQLIQNDASGPKIGPGVDRLHQHLLRRHVPVSADGVAKAGQVRICVADDACHPKIPQLDVSSCVDKQVRGFDIPMNNSLGMRVVQRRQQAAHDRKHVVKRKRLTVLEQLAQVVTLDQLHHQIGSSLVPIGVEDADDVVVVKNAGSAPLRQKSRLQFFRLLG